MDQIVPSWCHVREPWYAGGELPLPDFGLTCSECGTDLAGASRHACPTCGLEFDPVLLAPPTKWFEVDRLSSAGLPQHVVVDLLAEAFIPYVLTDEHGVFEIIGGPVPQRLRVAGEFYFDLLFLVTQENRRLAQRRSDAQSHTWTCVHCGEESPDSFEVCWRCRQPSAT